MIKPVFLILLVFICSMSMKAQNALDLFNQAVSQYEEQHYSDAKETIVEAIALAKEEKWEGEDKVSILLWKCGIEEKVDISQAILDYLDVLEVCANTLGENHSYYLIGLISLAGLYRTRGDYGKALPFCLEALENTENNLGKDHSDYGIRLNDLGLLYSKMGDYAKALPLYLEALDNTEKSLDKIHIQYGKIVNNLALLYKSMGEYAKALPLFLEALENTEMRLGVDHSEYGIRLNNLADLYRSMGEYAKALPLYLEALKNTDNSLGKDHSYYGIRLNDLALLFQSMGEYGKALPLFLEALENTEKSLGKENSQYSATLNNLALLYQVMGEYSKALPFYLQVLENVQKVQGKDQLQYSMVLNNLALLYEKMGEYTKALPLYLEALENTRNSLGKDHSQYGQILNNLATLYEGMGEYEQAIAFYQNGIESNKRFLANNILGLSENSKAILIKKSFFYTEVLQSLMVQFPDLKSNSVTQAWEDILFYKGLALKSGNLLKQKLQASNDMVVVNMITELDLYQNLVNKELAKPIDKQSPSLAEYQTKAKAAELRLLTKSQDFKELKEGLSAKYENLIKHLKPGEVAIDFTNFDFRRKIWTDTTYYAAYIIRPELSEPEMVLLFTEKELLKIADVSTSNPSAINTNYLKRGAEPINYDFSTINLYNLVWEKLMPHLKDIKTVYLSPTGNLSKVSFAAMQDSMGEYIGEKYQINYMLSLTDLLFKKTAAAPTSFLLAGGINYEYNATKKEAIKDTFDFSATARRGLRGNTWTYLEGTKIESQKIETLLKTANKQTIYFSEENATEKNIKLALTQSPSVFHIATHGFYIPMDTKRKEINSQTENVYKANEDPMYRSGLLLAGGNYAWENGGNPYEEEDGILLAKEISTMNLSKTQLVVLSACETGLGDLNGSEGVMGLQRALKMAGVQYQITTLWQVPDAETVEFMELFYTDWISGSTIEKSFNKAQLTMSKKYADDPYKWGAFVLYQ